MTSSTATDRTFSPPLVRLTLTLGPEERHAVARLVPLSGATSRTDAMRDLVARLASSSPAVRSRLGAATVPPLPTDTSRSRRLDLRLAASDRAALEQWCAGQLRPQDALRAALHTLAADPRLSVELGYRQNEDAGPTVEAPTAPTRPEPVPRTGHRRPPEPTPQVQRAPSPRRCPTDPTQPALRSAPRSTPQPLRRRRPPRPEPVSSAWYEPPSATSAPWPPTPRTIPQVEVADSWQTSTLLKELKSGREPIQFAPAWTDEVEDAVEDLVEVLPGGDIVRIVIGFRQEPWEECDVDGDLVASGTAWILVPVRRPKSVAREMLHLAHAAGGVNLEARVHRVEEGRSTGAIVELVVSGPY